MSGSELVVVGAINVDLVVAAPQLPAPGETVVGPGVERFGGGKGANAAVAAARSGVSVHLVGAVGADDTGRAAAAELADDGVDVAAVALLDEVPTGVALIVVDPRGENQIAVGAGANAAVTPEQVTDALDPLLAEAGCVLVSTEIPDPAVIAAVRAATTAGVPCVLNPAPVTRAVVDLLELGPLLTPNRSELLDLLDQLDHEGVEDRAPHERPDRRDHHEHAGLAEITHAAVRVHDRTGAPVVVTLGGDGALVVRAGAEPIHIAARAAEVRDTTGAGDTFNGVLAGALAAGTSLDAAVATAMVAAGLSVGMIGARSGMPTREQIDAARAG